MTLYPRAQVRLLIQINLQREKQRGLQVRLERVLNLGWRGCEHCNEDLVGK